MATLNQLGLTNLVIDRINLAKNRRMFTVTLIKRETVSAVLHEDVSEVIVYSDRKTGSTALFEGLFHSQGGFTTAVHLHNAHEFFEERAHRIQDRIQRSKTVFPKVYIVNSFRDPIDRKISEFFHLTKPVSSAEGLQEKFDAFVRDYYAPPALREIMQILGIGFDQLEKHEKYATCQVENIVLIILKHKYAADWSDILSTLMEREIEIKQSNVTQSELYVQFKQECTVPDHFRIAATHSEEFVQLS